MADARAQLIHIEVDRRLGHEWDEWDGNPLPNGGDYTSSPWLFFRYAALTVGVVVVAVLALGYLVAPRLETALPGLARILMWAVLGASGIALVWLGLIALSFAIDRPLLPEFLAERGPYLKLMDATSRVASWLGRRDWVENASVQVYNALALQRRRRVGPGELLVLIPRCLSKATLDGVLGIAARHNVPAFVATRGQLARRVIRERRPRAVVAVACERDMVTGLRDVAGKIPVLGLTMHLPAGPCRDAVVDLDLMERWVAQYLS